MSASRAALRGGEAGGDVDHRRIDRRDEIDCPFRFLDSSLAGLVVRTDDARFEEYRRWCVIVVAHRYIGVNVQGGKTSLEERFLAVLSIACTRVRREGEFDRAADTTPERECLAADPTVFTSRRTPARGLVLERGRELPQAPTQSQSLRRTPRPEGRARGRKHQPPGRRYRA